jgi:hypothetical protein
LSASARASFKTAELFSVSFITCSKAAAAAENGYEYRLCAGAAAITVIREGKPVANEERYRSVPPIRMVDITEAPMIFRQLLGEQTHADVVSMRLVPKSIGWIGKIALR